MPRRTFFFSQRTQATNPKPRKRHWLLSLPPYVKTFTQNKGPIKTQRIGSHRSHRQSKPDAANTLIPILQIR